MILGTMQYMAPEQFDGVEADRRTDIFAFGVVLHEMVTGKKAFEGKSQVLLISAIATADAAAGVARAARSAAARSTTSSRRASRRTRPIAGRTRAICWPSCSGSPTAARTTGFSVSTAAGRPERRWIALGRARRPPLCWSRRWRCRPICISRVQPNPRNCASASRATSPRSRLKPRPERRLRFATFSASDSAISPDGRTIVFRARPTTADTWFLYLRPVGAVAPQRLAGTEDAPQPFWSADSQSVAFVKRRETAAGARRRAARRRTSAMCRRDSRAARGTATARSSSARPRDSSSCPRKGERRRR